MLEVDNNPIILGAPVSVPLTSVSAPTSETKASYTIQTALKLEAKALGTLGNAVTVKAEANTSDNLAVSVAGNALTILLANATGSKNTMTLIAAAINASTPANTLVNAIVITGSTQMTAFTVQSLSGGVNGSVGYLDEVRFDTDGNRWECIGIVGGLYYWALPINCFPAVDTEYIAYIENGVPVYKKKIVTVTPTTSPGTTSVFVATNYALVEASGTVDFSATVTTQLPTIYSSQTSGVTCGVTKNGDNIQLLYISVTAPYLNKPATIYVKYKK